MLVYQSAWLKRYHPQAFYCGILNNQPMGFWNPQIVIHDAKRHGIKVLPVEVNASDGVCSVQDAAIRMGYNYVRGFGEAAIERVLDARSGGRIRGLGGLLPADAAPAAAGRAPDPRWRLRRFGQARGASSSGHWASSTIAPTRSR